MWMYRLQAAANTANDISVAIIRHQFTLFTLSCFLSFSFPLIRFLFRSFSFRPFLSFSFFLVLFFPSLIPSRWFSSPPPSVKCRWRNFRRVFFSSFCRRKEPSTTIQYAREHVSLCPWHFDEKERRLHSQLTIKWLILWWCLSFPCAKNNQRATQHFRKRRGNRRMWWRRRRVPWCLLVPTRKKNESEQIEWHFTLQRQIK